MRVYPFNFGSGGVRTGMVRILVTTTSFQDTPGQHLEVLSKSGFEVVRARGPLTEAQLLLLLQGEGFDGLLNGDDAITAKVIDAALPRLKVIAKYGIGLDSIDVQHATARDIAVLFTPGVNHTTVAEHTIGMMIALSKHFWPHLRSTKAGQWKRITGNELAGKWLALLGFGRIGREVAKRARAFDMQLVAFDPQWDDAFASEHGVTRASSAEDCIHGADIISLHMNLGNGNRKWFNRERLAELKPGALLINTARGGLVDEAAICEACASGALGGYATDVMEPEPPPSDHPFAGIDNILVTPHVGSRTFESVERQGIRAASNIVNFLTGNADYVRAN